MGLYTLSPKSQALATNHRQVTGRGGLMAWQHLLYRLLHVQGCQLLEYQRVPLNWRWGEGRRKEVSGCCWWVLGLTSRPASQPLLPPQQHNPAPVSDVQRPGWGGSLDLGNMFTNPIGVGSADTPPFLGGVGSASVCSQENGWPPDICEPLHLSSGLSLPDL